MKAPPPAATPPAPPRRFQFSLLAMMIAMFAFAVAAAPASYLVRGLKGDANMALIGMLALLAAPMLVMIVLSLTISVLRWWKP